MTDKIDERYLKAVREKATIFKGPYKPDSLLEHPKNGYKERSFLVSLVNFLGDGFYVGLRYCSFFSPQSLL